MKLHSAEHRPETPSQGPTDSLPADSAPDFPGQFAGDGLSRVLPEARVPTLGRSPMRRIAIINQKGGVGKTTTAVNLGAALARLGKRVLVIDMDPQANASMNLGAELHPGEPSTYSILTQGGRVADTIRGTSTPGLSILPAHLDLSGAELELASAIGRETILKDALDEWEQEETARTGRAPADVILMDNPPSLGLLSVNGLAASKEVLIAVQTEFFALQGLSKLVEVVQLLRRRLNPDLEITAVLACLYDSRLRLGREVLAELRTHFPEQVFKRPISQNVKLAETPSFSRTIFEYAPESKGAEDYLAVAREFIARENANQESSEVRSLEFQAAVTLQDEPPTLSDEEPTSWIRPETVVAADVDEAGPPEQDAPELGEPDIESPPSDTPLDESPEVEEAEPEDSPAPEVSETAALAEEAVLPEETPLDPVPVEAAAPLSTPVDSQASYRGEERSDSPRRNAPSRGGPLPV